MTAAAASSVATAAQRYRRALALVRRATADLVVFAVGGGSTAELVRQLDESMELLRKARRVVEADAG